MLTGTSRIEKVMREKAVKVLIISLFLFALCSTICAQINFTSLKGYNYIYTKQRYLDSSVPADSLESIQYFDGLGRLIQTVNYKYSPNGKDIIQPVEYDQYSREVIKYLPYTATSSSPSGIYRSSWKTEQSAFYTTTLGYTTDGSKAYAETVFEKSPLNRVMKQGAPGDAWKVINTTTARQSTEHVVSYEYSVNTSNEVYYWTISGTYSDITFTRRSYSAKTLYKNVVYDENNNPSTEYKDLQNKVVLKKDANGGKTYYIYDDFGLLRMVMPPLATATLASSASFKYSNTTFQELCYYYEYDSRSRMIRKKIPGTNGIYTLTYDNLDRLIESTDPNNVRSYTEYDAFSRPIVTGIYVNGVKKWLTKTSYGSYILNGVNYASKYPYSKTYSYTKATNIKDKIAVTLVKVLNPESDMTDSIFTVTYYDKNDRVIETFSLNHLRGYDRVSYRYRYDNSDAILETSRYHIINTAEETAVERFSYDHVNRLLTSGFIVSGQSKFTTLAAMNYNEAGQMITKILGGGLQTVDYKYNIRNWLTQINDPSVYTTNDSFALRLTYTGNCYNGNINKMEWYNGKASLRKVYDFSYDKLNRLTGSGYSEYLKGTLLPSSSGKYLENYTYDDNGNISSVVRNGCANDGTNLIATLDNLTYKYENSNYSNQLKSVGDNIADVFGRGDFNEYSSDGYANQEYWYDNNGNMTKDLNRNLIFTYNHLNLPDTVKNINNKLVFNIIYAADGRKLRQKIYADDASINNGVYDYIGPFVYRNDLLKYVLTSEGWCVPVGPSYVYHLKDHLGNVRTVFRAAISGITVLQKNDYYPFGGLMGESTGTSNYNNRYMYNGKERLDAVRSAYGVDFNMYDYGARFYDPQIGRWHTLDKLAEKYISISPFAYCANNPIVFVDPNGQKILFVNGYWASGAVGNAIGSNSAGKNYWGSGFTSAAQNFFNDHSKVTDANYIDGSSKWGGDQSGSDRYNLGYQYAKDNYNSLIENIEDGETFKLVTHSEGAAYGAGIAQYLMEQGQKVETIVHLSADEADEFSTPEGPDTYQVGYNGDWVTGNKEISGTDKSGVVSKFDKTMDKIMYSHGSTKSASVFKDVKALLNVAIQGASAVNVTETASGIKFTIVRDNTKKEEEKK